MMNIADIFYNPLVSKALIILLVGLLEQFIYSWHLLQLTRKKAVSSSVILFLHLNIYLLLIASIINDMNKILWFVPVYAVGCSIGNYIRIRVRQYKDKLEKQALEKARRQKRDKKKVYKKELHKSSK